MLNVEEDFAAVAVVLNENVQRVGAVDPSEESRVRRERDDGILDNREMAFERLRVLLQKRVDETEQLHDSFILAEILVTCRRTFVSSNAREEEEGRSPPFNRKL